GEEGRGGGRGRDHVGVEGVRAERFELEVALAEGADHAVFRGGAGINRDRQTGTSGEVVAITILLTEIARPCRLVVDRAVERRVNAQITTQLDAGVGARRLRFTPPAFWNPCDSVLHGLAGTIPKSQDQGGRPKR